MKRSLIVAILLMGALLCAGAEQVYVRNRPFKGAVSRLEGKVWVEFKPLIEALGLVLQGDEQSGYWISQDPEFTGPGAGKVSIEGTELECSSNTGSLLVPLESAGQLLGARVVLNKTTGTVDVSLVKTKGEQPTSAVASQELSGAYNLIEYSIPDEALCIYVQPALTKAKSEFKNVQFILCNLTHPSKALMKFKPTQDRSFPEVALVDGQGHVLFTMRGNHVIDQGLIKQMRKNVKQ